MEEEEETAVQKMPVGVSQEEKGGHIELIASRKENFFPMSLNHYIDKHCSVPDNYLNVR